jgi:hypothetical protein
MRIITVAIYSVLSKDFYGIHDTGMSADKRMKIVESRAGCNNCSHDVIL